MLAIDDVSLCQITSKTVTDSYAIVISDAEFVSSGLRQESNVRPNRAGVLSPQKVQEVVAKIVQILTV